MARSRRGFPARGHQRKSSWAVGPIANEEAIATNGKRLWTQGVALVSEAEVTIVRIRGLMSIYLSLATSSLDGFAGAAGLCIVNSDVFNVGATAVPDPLNDLEFGGWMWHSFFDVRGIAAQSAGADVSINAFSAVYRKEIDSKAMRKLGEFETLVGVVNVAEGGTASMEFNADSRMLVKLI